MKSKLLLLVRSETLVMTRNQGVLMQEEKSMASKDCCFFDLMTLRQGSLPKVIQVERNRAGIQSRSFDQYFTFAPSFLILSPNNCLTI